MWISKKRSHVWATCCKLVPWESIFPKRSHLNGNSKQDFIHRVKKLNYLKVSRFHHSLWEWTVTLSIGLHQWDHNTWHTFMRLIPKELTDRLIHRGMVSLKCIMIRVWMAGHDPTLYSRFFHTRIPHPNFFHRYPEYHFLFRIHRPHFGESRFSPSSLIPNPGRIAYFG